MSPALSAAMLLLAELRPKVMVCLFLALPKPVPAVLSRSHVHCTAPGVQPAFPCTDLHHVALSQHVRSQCAAHRSPVVTTSLARQDCAPRTGSNQGPDERECAHCLSLLQGLVDSGQLSAQARLLITGHSLGGALAVLAAFDIKRAMPEFRVQMYTYGTPYPGNRALAREFNELLPDTWHLIHDGVCPWLDCWGRMLAWEAACTAVRQSCSSHATRHTLLMTCTC